MASVNVMSRYSPGETEQYHGNCQYGKVNWPGFELGRSVERAPTGEVFSLSEQVTGGVSPVFKTRSTGINTNYLSPLVQAVSEIWLRNLNVEKLH